MLRSPTFGGGVDFKAKIRQIQFRLQRRELIVRSQDPKLDLRGYTPLYFYGQNR